MRLPLLLLLPACAFAFFNFDELREKAKEAKGKLRERFGKLSTENRAKLQKAFGGDPEARKARLQKIFERKLNRTSLTEEQRQKLQERLDKITPVKTEKPTEDAAVDLFEVNMKEGVSDYLFQGDMLLTDNQLDAIEMQLSEIDDPLRPKRQASTVYSKWASNIVYYFFDPSLNARKQASVAAALDYLQSRTCVNFVQSSTAANRIRVFNGAGCYATLGMIGGQQDLSLGDGCEVIGTVAHEFTHALGVWHSQMRSDRDTYVTIDLSDVPSSAQGNFAKLQASQNSIYTPYEYGGFMHYGANAFTQTQGKLSIVPKDTRYIYTMGNRQISFYDIKMINDHYGCTAKCPAATSAQCKNGGTPNPRNCATCNCPLGYAGTLCDQRPTGCGETLTATTAWQTKQFTFGNTTDSTNVRDVFTMCNHWISAPAGQQIQVKITSMYNPQCQYGCPFNGLEIKTDADTKMTNPRFCCPELMNQELTSQLNPTPIVAFNRYYYNTFTFQYRYVAAGPAPATSAPAPATPAPAPTTTKAPVVSINCVNMNTDANCAQNVAAGFCTMMPQYTFQTIKYNCGKACGMCGKAANPCVDTHAQCADLKAAGYCQSLQPMEAEYHCAKTCGFCEKPN